MLYYYTYTVNCGTITYTGACTIDKIFKQVNPNSLPLIKIVACYDNFHNAMKHAVSLGFKLLPTPAVICNETGEYFINASAAARKFDIDRSNLFCHLNNIGSWKTLRGMTFRYVNKIQRNNS